MKVKVLCRKFECHKDIQPIDSQQEGLGVAFFATGPGFGSYNVYLYDTQISHTKLLDARRLT